MLVDRVQDTLRYAIARNPDLEPELKALASWLCHAVAQRTAGPAAGGADGDKAKSAARIKVRFTRCGIKLVDLDNLAGGFKHLQDALKEEHIIPDDDPGTISVEFHQRKVKRADMGTEIIIEPIR